MPARPKDVSAGYFIHSGTLKPPEGLPQAATALWRRIMQTTPAGQLRPADVPLLAMFCRVSGSPPMPSRTSSKTDRLMRAAKSRRG